MEKKAVWGLQVERVLCCVVLETLSIPAVARLPQNDFPTLEFVVVMGDPFVEALFNIHTCDHS